MPRESLASKRSRMALLIERLRATYPDAHCELVYSSPLELLVATILSAQCTDKQVNIVTAELFKKYRSAHDFARSSQSELESDIKRIGLFRNKAKSIRACCESLIVDHNGRVPPDMKSLVALAGVGRKTANVVLGNAFGINEGIVVDTHVGRLANRFRFTKESNAEKIERELIKLTPPEHWTMLSHWLIWHGRRRCYARNPDCGACEARAQCPSAGVAAKG